MRETCKQDFQNTVTSDIFFFTLSITVCVVRWSKRVGHTLLIWRFVLISGNHKETFKAGIKCKRKSTGKVWQDRSNYGIRVIIDNFAGLKFKFDHAHLLLCWRDTYWSVSNYQTIEGNVKLER